MMAAYWHLLDIKSGTASTRKGIRVQRGIVNERVQLISTATVSLTFWHYIRIRLLLDFSFMNTTYESLIRVTLIDLCRWAPNLNSNRMANLAILMRPDFESFRSAQKSTEKVKYFLNLHSRVYPYIHSPR